MSLTYIDRNIVDILYRNASLPITSVAHELNLDTDKVIEIVKRLISEDIIKKFTAILDPAKLGFNESAYIFIESEENYPNVVKEATRRAKEWGGVESLYVVYGDKDVIAKIHAKDIVDIENFATNALMNVTWFQESETYRITHRIRAWGIDYPPLEQVGAKQVRLEELDISILRELQADCRQKNDPIKLGSKLNCSPVDISNRISSLEKTGVIRGYSIILNLLYLKMLKAIMFVNIKRGYYHKVKENLLTIENGTMRKDRFHIPFIQSGLGHKYADICLDLVAEDLNHLDILTDVIREIEGVKSTIIYLASKILVEDTCLPI